ncbi:hypothetical protein BASA61_009013 [Batrachochytrium salamandrivorans]|nr:hypothetical protein BASA61_009013 [Batrachochytrium salamandrivorans]
MGQESGSSQSSPENGPMPGSSQDPPEKKSGKSCVFKDVRKDPICGPILLELFILRTKLRILILRFGNRTRNSTN